MATVRLLGDSTMDDLYWLLNGDGSNVEEATAATVEGQLKQKLDRHLYTIVNHAYDGFTTEDVLGTRTRAIGSVLPGVGGKYDAYMLQRDPEAVRTVKPLEALENSLPADGTHYVVIAWEGMILEKI
jgi:hypothetical protein